MVHPTKTIGFICFLITTSRESKIVFFNDFGTTNHHGVYLIGHTDTLNFFFCLLLNITLFLKDKNINKSLTAWTIGWETLVLQVEENTF